MFSVFKKNILYVFSYNIDPGKKVKLVQVYTF